MMQPFSFIADESVPLPRDRCDAAGTKQWPFGFRWRAAKLLRVSFRSWCRRGSNPAGWLAGASKPVAPHLSIG